MAVSSALFVGESGARAVSAGLSYHWRLRRPAAAAHTDTAAGTRAVERAVIVERFIDTRLGGNATISRDRCQLRLTRGECVGLCAHKTNAGDVIFVFSTYVMIFYEPKRACSHQQRSASAIIVTACVHMCTCIIAHIESRAACVRCV